MIYHPTMIILILIIALIISYRQEKIFHLVALAIPIISASCLYYLPENNTVELFNLTLIYEGSGYNKLIGTAFILVLFSANIYTLGQNKKSEIILGNAYAAFAFFCLLAGDFFSLFIGLELMMVVSSAIIFIGGLRASLRSAKKYFLTHLMSSNMIIIGIAYLISKDNNLALVSVTELLINPQYSKVMLTIMLIGMLINIAAFPFSGWMVNYYPKASPSGFLYLISFTTKVSIMVLVKVFAGYKLLEYAAIIMMLYASIKAIFENNIFSLLCYLSIMAMGLMLLGISDGSDTAILATICYLFVHVIYKSLLSISVASIIDNTEIKNCSDLKRIKNKVVVAGILISIALMINIPASSSFYIKSAISHQYVGSPIYWVITLLSFMTIFALPWKKYFLSKDTITINLNIYSKISILFMTTVLVIIGFMGFSLPLISTINTFEEIKLISTESFKQTAIIVISLIVAMIYATKRINTNPINFTEWIGDILFYSYAKWLNIKPNKESIREPWAIESLERQISLKLASAHNQQTAIFVVFAIFIIMLIVLTKSV